MAPTRRDALLTLATSAVVSARGQDPEDDRRLHVPRAPNSDEDKKLPNGKSEKDEIAKDEHQRALNDAENLLSIAQDLRDELKKAGNYVVPVTSVKKTEEIEKLARRIRGRLKA